MATMIRGKFCKLEIDLSIAARFYECCACHITAPPIVVQIANREQIYARILDVPDGFDFVVTQGRPPEGWKRIEHPDPIAYETELYFCEKCSNVVVEQMSDGLKRALWLINNPSTVMQETTVKHQAEERLNAGMARFTSSDFEPL